MNGTFGWFHPSTHTRWGSRIRLSTWWMRSLRLLLVWLIALQFLFTFCLLALRSQQGRVIDRLGRREEIARNTGRITWVKRRLRRRSPSPLHRDRRKWTSRRIGFLDGISSKSLNGRFLDRVSVVSGRRRAHTRHFGCIVFIQDKASSSRYIICSRSSSRLRQI